MGFPSVPDNRWMCDWCYYSAAVVGSRLYAIDLSKYIVGSKFQVVYLVNRDVKGNLTLDVPKGRFNPYEKVWKGGCACNCNHFPSNCFLAIGVAIDGIKLVSTCYQRKKMKKKKNTYLIRSCAVF